MGEAVRDIWPGWIGRQAGSWPQAVDPSGQSGVRADRSDPPAQGPTPLERAFDEPSRWRFGQFGPAPLVEQRPQTTPPEDLQALERSEVRGEVLGRDRALPQSARQGAGVVLRRKKPMPGARTHPIGSPAGAKAPAHDDARLCQARHCHAVRRPQPVDRQADHPHRSEPHGLMYQLPLLDCSSRGSCCLPSWPSMVDGGSGWEICRLSAGYGTSERSLLD